MVATMPGSHLAEFLEVIVNDGSRSIETARCRPLLLPDGRSGVLWSGLVYPVGEAGSIDIDGEAVAPGLCKPAAVMGARAQFAIIDGEQDAYLLLAGSAIDAEAAAARLRGAGIAVHRMGRYLGDPVEEFAADWFVRFEKPAPAEPLRTLLGRLIGNIPDHQAVPESAEQIRSRLLHIELMAARERQAAVEYEHDSLKDAASQAVATSQELSALRAELEAEREARFSAEAATAPESPPTPSTTLRTGRLQNEIQTVFAMLLPEFRLARDSIRVVAIEYEDRGPIYRAFAELRGHPGRMPPAWKSFQSLPAWWERHINDGRDNTGRIYARLDRDNSCWKVLISHKSEQARDIAWLRKN